MYTCVLRSIKEIKVKRLISKGMSNIHLNSSCFNFVPVLFGSLLSGKLPPGKFPSIKFKFLPVEFSPWNIPTLDFNTKIF